MRLGLAAPERSGMRATRSRGEEEGTREYVLVVVNSHRNDDHVLPEWYQTQDDLAE